MKKIYMLYHSVMKNDSNAFPGMRLEIECQAQADCGPDYCPNRPSIRLGVTRWKALDGLFSRLCQRWRAGARLGPQGCGGRCSTAL